MTCPMRAAVCGGLALALALGCAGTRGTATPSAGPHARMAAGSERRVGSPYAYEWFIRAEIWRAKHDLPAALDAYPFALASSDEDPHVLARYATALDQAGDRARAEAALRDAFAQDPRSESAWMALASIAERHGELARALEAYERAEAAAPGSPRPSLALAALLERQGAPERARAVLARYAARVLPGAAGAQRARLLAAVMREDAEAAYAEARALGSLPFHGAGAFARAAELLLERERCGLALDLLERTGLQREHARLRLRALLDCGRLGAAELLLRETDPEVLGGVLEVARAYLRIGRPNAARELARSARAARPDDLEAVLVLAEAQLQSGELAAAAESFAQVPPNASRSPDARRGLARTLAAAGMPELGAEVRERASSAPPPAASAQ